MFDYSDRSQEIAIQNHFEVGEKPPRKIKLPKILAVIDQSGCTGCEACIQFCPVDCIEIVPGPKFPDMGKLVEVDLDRCIGCKLCAKHCPWDTITMIPSAESYQTANDWTLRSILKLDAQPGDVIWPLDRETLKVAAPEGTVEATPSEAIAGEAPAAEATPDDSSGNEPT